jgi:hypothetical protein
MEEGRSAFTTLTGRPTGKRIFGPKMDGNGDGKGSTIRNFVVCILHLIYSG